MSAGFVLGPCLLIAATAFAQADNVDSTAWAKTHFAAAEVHYQAGHIQQARDEYVRAYEMKPLPAFLFNIGQCDMEQHRYESALAFFEEYLRKQMTSKARLFAEARMEEARHLLREQADAARAIPVPAERSKP